MCHTLEFTEEPQMSEIGVVDATHFEDVIWTDFDAIRLSFALVAIHHRHELARLALAIDPRVGGHAGSDAVGLERVADRPVLAFGDEWIARIRTIGSSHRENCVASETHVDVNRTNRGARS
jgi:hypothetical protein